MKTILFTITCLCITVGLFAQSSAGVLKNAPKINLSNGQKITVASQVTVLGDFGMGMEINSSTASENALEVKKSTPENYTISNTLTKMKLNMNMMGQNNSYDSENKDNNSPEVAKVFEEKLNNPVDIIIDNTNGMVLADKSKAKKTDADDISNPADDLMKMFGDASDDGIVSGAFEIVPEGTKIGDSWADTAIGKDMKSIRTYTLKSISDNDAVLQLDVVSSAKNKLDFQGTEFEIKTDTKIKGEILTNIKTNLVKQRTTASDITGSFQLMGQDMPLSAKATSVSVYK